MILSTSPNSHDSFSRAPFTPTKPKISQQNKFPQNPVKTAPVRASFTKNQHPLETGSAGSLPQSKARVSAPLPPMKGGGPWTLVAPVCMGCSERWLVLYPGHLQGFINKSQRQSAIYTYTDLQSLKKSSFLCLVNKSLNLKVWKRP